MVLPLMNVPLMVPVTIMPLAGAGTGVPLSTWPVDLSNPLSFSLSSSLFCSLVSTLFASDVDALACAAVDGSLSPHWHASSFWRSPPHSKKASFTTCVLASITGMSPAALHLMVTFSSDARVVRSSTCNCRSSLKRPTNQSKSPSQPCGRGSLSAAYICSKCARSIGASAVNAPPAAVSSFAVPSRPNVLVTQPAQKSPASSATDTLQMTTSNMTHPCVTSSLSPTVSGP